MQSTLLPGRAGLLFLVQLPAVAAGGSSIFSVENELLDHPWHVATMFILVIGISVAHEFFFEWVNHKIKSTSAQKLKAHVEHEVMNLGLIGLWLTFVDALGITNDVWSTTLFHYTHFLLFVMMIILMGLTGTMLVTMKIAWKTWVRYERFWRLIVDDDLMPLGQKQLTLDAYWSRNQNAKRMVTCLQFFNATLPDEYRDVEFTRYLRKSQRRWLLQLLHLNKYSWLSLVVVIVAIAVLLDTSADSLRSSGELDIFYFVFTVGWGTLVFLFVIAGKTIGAFRAFCEQIDMSSLSPATYYRGAEVQFSSSRFFWFGRPQFTLQLLQMGLLYQVFYTAVVIVNIIPQAYAIPMGWVLVVMAFAPTIVIFAFLLPAMMPPFTCLASLGNFLDLDLLHTMSQSAETEPVETQRPALPKDFRSYFTKQYLLTSHLPNDMDDATPSSPMLQPA